MYGVIGSDLRDPTFLQKRARVSAPHLSIGGQREFASIVRLFKMSNMNSAFIIQSVELQIMRDSLAGIVKWGPHTIVEYIWITVNFFH